MSESLSESKVASPRTNDSKTVAYAGESISKEERDVVFAAQGLREGMFNERQLKTALANWTIYGETLLADYLQTVGLLAREHRERLEAAATVALLDLHAEQEISGSKSTLGSTLQRVDESGRVAKLLGISAAGGPGQSGMRSAVVRLTLIRKLGQGGLGTVWLARDENMQRFVALKEMQRLDDSSGLAIARFRREAEITGRLEHPGVVPVYELGEDQETERVFYTMRFLGKQTLHDAVAEYHERRDSGDDDPMILRNLLTAFVSVCQAIGHAHSRKVIHRDLKPENVAIDSFGQVIVIDWGLAKVVDETNLPEGLPEAGLSGDADSLHTAAGQVLGTPLYMAPEQAAGRTDEIDERTDIYGLGAILFAILTGVAPHESSRMDGAASGTRGLITVIAGRPTPRARDVNPDADPILDAICAKAMAKRRYARYQSATELADEVQRWMAGEPVRAYRESRSRRMGRWVQQHRRKSQALATVLIASLVAGVILVASSYENHIAKRASRFEEIKSEVREVDVQFAANFEHLAKNIRFMSNVPPIQGIVVARTAPPNSAAETEETWRARLEMIYEGLLRANQDYLMVAYLRIESGSAHELVRVERHMTDPAFIRRVPKARLARRQGDDFLDEVRALSPGEVKLAIAESAGSGENRNGFRPRLVGAAPVYDEVKGDVFGLVMIETDAVADAEQILARLPDRQAEIFITDRRGQIWVTSLPGRGIQVEAGTTNVSAVVPGTAAFFNAESVEPALILPQHGVIATRIRLNALDAAGSLVTVVHLAD